MNYLSTLTRPVPAHYGAERSIITPDGRGLNQQVRLTMTDGSTPRVRVLDPEAKNKLQVRILTPVGAKGETLNDSREITVTRAYWDANAKSTFMEGLFDSYDLPVYAVLSSAAGAAIGHFVPSYGALRGAGVGLAFMAGSSAGKAITSGEDKKANTVANRVGWVVGGATAAAGTAFAVKRR